MNNKIFGAVIALVMIAVLCCACASTTDAFKNSSVACDPGASSVLTLSHSTLVLPLDGTLGRLYAFHADKPLELQWRTENSAVAEVSMGIITGICRHNRGHLYGWGEHRKLHGHCQCRYGCGLFLAVA